MGFTSFLYVHVLQINVMLTPLFISSAEI